MRFTQLGKEITKDKAIELIKKAKEFSISEKKKGYKIKTKLSPRLKKIVKKHNLLTPTDFA